MGHMKKYDGDIIITQCINNVKHLLHNHSLDCLNVSEKYFLLPLKITCRAALHILSLACSGKSHETHWLCVNAVGHEGLEQWSCVSFSSHGSIGSKEGAPKFSKSLPQ